MTILLALALDLAFGDPPNQFHPVARMGDWFNKGRRLAPGQYRFWFGAGWVIAGLLIFAWPWRSGRAKAQDREMPSLIEALLLKAVFAYRDLRRNVAAVAQALAAGNLAEARRLTGWHLVSRDTQALSAEEVAGAAIESLAENITDSVTAPLLAYTLGGLPAAWGYRFVNTADAMWGYRSQEFEQLGKFAAQLDDILNWLPARLSGWLLVAAAGLAGEQAGRAAQVMLNQRRRAPSPNAGWTMSAAAGALGVTLTKRDTYTLEGGDGRLDAATIQRALRLADICVGLTVGLLCLSALAAGFWSRHKGGNA